MSIKLKQAQEADRSELIEMLWDNGMVHAEPIEDYLIAIEDDDVVGCIRLEVLAELMMIRPLVVSSSHRKKGIGRLLIKRVLKTDRIMGVMSRGSAIAFYETLGFKKAQRSILPVSQQQECLQCPDEGTCSPQPMIRNCDANKQM